MPECPKWPTAHVTTREDGCVKTAPSKLNLSPSPATVHLHRHESGVLSWKPISNTFWPTVHKKYLISYLNVAVSHSLLNQPLQPTYQVLHPCCRQKIKPYQRVTNPRSSNLTSKDNTTIIPGSPVSSFGFHPIYNEGHMYILYGIGASKYWVMVITGWRNAGIHDFTANNPILANFLG